MYSVACIVYIVLYIKYLVQCTVYNVQYISASVEYWRPSSLTP